MRQNTIRNLERLEMEHIRAARKHTEQAQTIRTVLGKARSLLDAGLTLGRQEANATDVHMVRRRRSKPAAPATSENGKASSGQGMGPAIIKAITESPDGLTPTEIWLRVNGKFRTSSRNPRGMLNVELRRLFKAQKVQKLDGRWFPAQ